MYLFSKKPTPKEAAKAAKRETRREVRSSQREMDREIRELDRQEKQVLLEIKQRAKSAPSANDPALKALAKNLVQVRKQRQQLFAAKANLGAVGMQATAMSSQVAAASALQSVTTAMGSANEAVDTKAMMKISTDFMRQTEKMNVTQEMMDDTLADAFDNDELEEEADQVTSQVLAELGVELDSQMVGLNVPSAKPVGEEGLTTEEQAALDEALPDLKARLDAL